MLSKKMVLLIGVIFLITFNMIFLSVTSRRNATDGSGSTALYIVSPFQKALTRSIGFVKDIWRHYFYLSSVSMENDRLRKELSFAAEKNNRLVEAELSNARLRNLLKFTEKTEGPLIAAEIIGKDPTSWHKTITIDKGSDDGVEKGDAVVSPEGVVGQVTDVASHYAKALLLIDHNSAVDALIQNSRARGVVHGESSGQCALKYVLRKHEIQTGDTVISSGLDGIFQKGLRVGVVSGVVKNSSGMFQVVTVKPFVDFETLEEVFVMARIKADEKEDG
ncbi:MAG: rod shape-determining protein MreC [Desulfobacterales bacterium]|nr:rod shape-determining protein MreC [Desulfobacterales bacterium]